MKDTTNAEKVMIQFKQELKNMRGAAKDDDVMPANVFFAFMDVIVPVIDDVIENNKQLKEKLDECK